MLKFICYPKCTTCQRAKKWLDDNIIEYEIKPLIEEYFIDEKSKIEEYNSML